MSISGRAQGHTLTLDGRGGGQRLPDHLKASTSQRADGTLETVVEHGEQFDLALEVSYQAHKKLGESRADFQARVGDFITNMRCAHVARQGPFLLSQRAILRRLLSSSTHPRRVPRHGEPDAQKVPPPAGLIAVFEIVAGDDNRVSLEEYMSNFVGTNRWARSAGRDDDQFGSFPPRAGL